MKSLSITPSQIQNFIYLLADAPALLQDFYFENHDKVFERKSNWTIPMNRACEKWLKKELKSYAKSLREENEEIKSEGEVSVDLFEIARENRSRISLLMKVIEKIN